MMNKATTLREVLDNLAPYLLDIAIDHENDFAPCILILFPINWKIFKNVEYIVESEEFSTGANKFTFSMKRSDGDFDEMVEFIQTIIDWNHEYEEKTKLLEEKKLEFLREQEEKLKAMEEEILPKPLSYEGITLGEVDSSGNQYLPPMENMELEGEFKPTKSIKERYSKDAIKAQKEPKAPATGMIEMEDGYQPIEMGKGHKKPSKSPEIVYEEDGDEPTPELPTENFPTMQVMDMPDELPDDEDPEEIARLDAMVNTIGTNSIFKGAK
jgi:hypothetical protein